MHFSPDIDFNSTPLGALRDMLQARGSHRAGFGPHCVLVRQGLAHAPTYLASWRGKPALNRDGTARHFKSMNFARAWLAAADATNGATLRHQCS